MRAVRPVLLVPVMFTVGDLEWHLESYPDDYELIFQGDLTFYCLKQRDSNLVQLEFGEVIEFISDNHRSRT